MYFYCYVYVFLLLCLCISIVVLFLFCVFCFIVLFCCVCIQICSELLSPGVNQVAVNEIYHIIFQIIYREKLIKKFRVCGCAVD
jgi:hypothetical protein